MRLGFFFAPLKFGLIESRPQHVPCGRTILVLGALVLALDHDAGRKMRHADRAVGGIDMLPAGSARAISIDAYVFFIDFYLDRLIDDRKCPD